MSAAIDPVRVVVDPSASSNISKTRGLREPTARVHSPGLLTGVAMNSDDNDDGEDDTCMSMRKFTFCRHFCARYAVSASAQSSSARIPDH